MNLFVISKNPIKCAEYLDDKRVVKMCLETAQLLATAINENGGEATYKSTHVNHPVAIWVRSSRMNYMWTLKHFLGLLKEYKSRYNREHKCHEYIREFIKGIDIIPKGNLTEFVNCAANNSLNISFKRIPNVHLAYRFYLNERWRLDKREPTWYAKKI
jgi:hypothetical protein